MVLVVRNHLLEVPVQLGGELLVPEGAALLVKDFVDGGDQLQLLLSVGLGEAVDTEGVQHHRGTLELLVSQVHGSDEEESLEGDGGHHVKVSGVGFHNLAELKQRYDMPTAQPLPSLILLLHGSGEELLEGKKLGHGHGDAVGVSNSNSQEGACRESVISRPADDIFCRKFSI